MEKCLEGISKKPTRYGKRKRRMDERKTDTWEEKARIRLEKGRATTEDDWWKKYYEKALNKMNERINLGEEEKKKVKEKERLEKKKIILSRGHQDIIIDEALKNFIDAQSTDPTVRKEAISKEIDFIRKKWSEMRQKQLEKS
jgi:hypothetical protein